MASNIKGLAVLKSAFKLHCSRDKPCFLADHKVTNRPCCKCMMKIIDADEWLHEDHLCTGPECNGRGETTDSKAGLARRTQHYGYEFNFKAKQMLRETRPLESNLAVHVLAEVLRNNFPDGELPDQCIINEYKVGQSIAAHTDKLCFGNVVMTVSLLGSCRMTFTSKRKESLTLELNAGDIVLLEDEARYDYEHSIERIRVRDVDSNDRRRVSATYRTSV